MEQGIKIPPSTMRADHEVNMRGTQEVIFAPRYDYQTYLAAGQSSLTFFQNPIGQNGRTILDTNMESAGQLPAPQSFVITSIALEIYPSAAPSADAGTNIDDVYNIAKGGALSLRVGSKNYVEQAVLGNFPSTHRLGGFTDADYAAMTGQIYQITPITLPESQNFSVKLSWDAPVAITADARIGVQLRGFLYRNAQ